MPDWFDRLDRRITHSMAAYGVFAPRLALGVVFLWFGALKLVPGLSPAETLAGRTVETLTFGIVPTSVAVPVLAVWECLIGLGLLSGRFLRATLLLFPSETVSHLPWAPTLEGRYIIKTSCW